MSINAVVDSISIGPKKVLPNEDGGGGWDDRTIEGSLFLAGRERGQPVLVFYEPYPADVNLLLYQKIWGGDSSIMLGETEIAKRESCTHIRFVVPWISEVIDHEKEKLNHA